MIHQPQAVLASAVGQTPGYSQASQPVWVVRTPQQHNFGFHPQGKAVPSQGKISTGPAMVAPAMVAPTMVAPTMVAPTMVARALAAPTIASRPGTSSLQSQSSRPSPTSTKIGPELIKINSAIKGLKLCRKLVKNSYQ